MIRIALASFVAGFAVRSVPAAMRSGRPFAVGLVLVGAVAGALVAYDAVGDYSDHDQGVPIVGALSALSANILALACAAGGALFAHRNVDA